MLSPKVAQNCATSLGLSKTFQNNIPKVAHLAKIGQSSQPVAMIKLFFPSSNKLECLSMPSLFSLNNCE
jgi:hypothetical protein